MKASKSFLLFLAFVQPILSFSQPKISSLSEIESQAKSGIDTIINISKYAIGGVMAIALIFIIYAMATNNPKGKDYLIGWVVALIVYLIGIAII